MFVRDHFLVRPLCVERSCEVARYHQSEGNLWMLLVDNSANPIAVRYKSLRSPLSCALNRCVIYEIFIFSSKSQRNQPNEFPVFSSVLCDWIISLVLEWEHHHHSAQRWQMTSLGQFCGNHRRCGALHRCRCVNGHFQDSVPFRFSQYKCTVWQTSKRSLKSSAWNVMQNYPTVQQALVYVFVYRWNTPNISALGFFFSPWSSTELNEDKKKPRLLFARPPSSLLLRPWDIHEKKCRLLFVPGSATGLTPGECSSIMNSNPLTTKILHHQDDLPIGHLVNGHERTDDLVTVVGCVLITITRIERLCAQKEEGLFCVWLFEVNQKKWVEHDSFWVFQWQYFSNFHFWPLMSHLVFWKTASTYN